MHDDGKIDRLMEGLKYFVKIEVTKANGERFEECAVVVRRQSHLEG